MGKSQYKSAAEWRKANPRDYAQAKRDGVLNDICDYFGWDRIKNKVPPRYWYNKERVIEEARKHKTISSWAKSSYACWDSAKKHGWFEEATEHMNIKKKPAGFWENKENCIASARKYTNIKSWYKDDYGAWENSKKFGWFDECVAHMKSTRKSTGYWVDKEVVLASARKYKTKNEWRKNEPGAMESAKKHGWLEESTAHMINMRKKWTKELCIEEARKYEMKFDWVQASSGSYQKAKKEGWFEEATAHMKKRK